MMQLYYVKSDLFGVPKGRVERFADHRAGALVLAGDIEPYDEKRHGKAPGAPPVEAARAVARARDGETRLQAADQGQGGKKR